jgi:hypothetical protein
MKRFDPADLRKGLRGYPVIARFVAIVNLVLYPVILPIAVVIAGIEEIKGEVKSNFLTLVGAAFLPWKKTK